MATETRRSPVRTVGYLLLILLGAAGVAWAGPWIRLSLKDGSQVEGELQSFTEGSYRVLLGSQSVEIPEEEVADMQYLRGSSRALEPEKREPRSVEPPAPAPTPAVTPRASPPAPFQEKEDAGSGYDLSQAFSFQPRVGDRLHVTRWHRTTRRGYAQDGEQQELQWVDTIEQVDGTAVVTRLRRFLSFKGSQAVNVDGLEIRITREGGAVSFEPLSDNSVSPDLLALMEEEFARGGLARPEYLPERAVEIGDSWHLSIGESRLAQELESGGLEFDTTRSSARSTLLAVDKGLANISLSFRLKPIGLEGVPLDDSAVLVASTSLWVPLAGDSPVVRHEESGHFDCQIQGERLGMEISTVVETRLERTDFDGREPNRLRGR